MPIYEYKCPECEHIFEQFLRIADYTPTASCPDCGKESTRIYSPVHFSVDNWDRRGWQPAVGRPLKNKADLKDWLKANNMSEVGPEDAKAVKERRKELLESRKAKKDASTR